MKPKLSERLEKLGRFDWSALGPSAGNEPQNV
jgi:hypothetical protein